MSDTWTLIANPTAGGGHGRRVAERATLALQNAGQAIELRYTRKQGHATELAREAVAGGVPRLVVCGGDGTISEVLPALAGSPTALGLLPFGTANDLARALAVPRKIAAAVQPLLGGQWGGRTPGSPPQMPIARRRRRRTVLVWAPQRQCLFC